MFKSTTNFSSSQRQKLLSITIPCLVGWVSTYLTTDILEMYAYGLFVWLPLVIGSTSTIIYGYRNQVSDKSARSNAFFTLLIFCVGLLLFAWEGIICLVMAAPIGLIMTYVGYLIARALFPNAQTNGNQTASTLLLLSVPTLMAFESRISKTDELRSVTSFIEITATPESVWDNVVAFPKLSSPTEFIFRTGIAYPTSATIKGSGIGAVRHCNFSTGSFVEPITVWNKPELLRFSVEHQPATMREISLYDIEPNHLHGYWISKEGQFKLTKLRNGNTLLEGTTWYVNKIQPGMYWTIWSDFIVHKIHNRVLQHIKVNTEKQTQ